MNQPARHPHPSTTAGVFVCLLLAQGIVHAAPEEKPVVTNDNAVLQESIKREAARQDRVSTGIVDLHAELRGFIEDMETNRIYKEVEGKTLTTAAGKLDAANNDFVRSAAGSLHNAADQPVARRDQLASAGGDIKGAIGELTALMKLTKAFLGNDQLDSEVEQIIRSLEEAIEKSTKLGQEMAEGKQPEARRFDELAAEQDKIAARTESLREMLRQSAKDSVTATEQEKLTRAEDVMSEKPADRSMRKAGKDIRESDIASAVNEQKKALEGMQELAKALKNPEESALAEVKKSLEKILEEQAKLRERTEAMDKPEMAEKAEDLQREQKELMDRLVELAKSEPMEDGAPGQKPSGMNGEPQKMAQQALAQQEKAEQALAEQDQPAATAAQREAEQALSEAIEQISNEQVEQMPPSDAEFQPGEGEPGEGKPGEGKPGEGKPGEGKPGEGKPGEGKPGEGKPGEGKPGKGTKPGKGSSGIASKNVFGVAPEDDQATWQSLDDVDRAGLGENFSRELPREYRDMLKAYYEQLSK
jgi:uncharacterized low-complexity protein